MAATRSNALMPGRRAAAWWGWSFVLLLLLSAGIASVPTGGVPTATTRTFYLDHAAVIVAAQVVGLAAAMAFLPFTRALQEQAHQGAGSASLITRAGIAVCGAAIATAIPVLWLCAVAPHASDALIGRLVRACDLLDAALFVTIVAFAASIARAAAIAWLRGLAALVALFAAARSSLLLAGSDALQLLAPVAFLTQVAALSVAALMRRPVLRRPAPMTDRRRLLVR